MIHLDTNFLIQALVPGSLAETKLLAWLTAGEDFAASTIAWSEFTPQEELLVQLLLSAPEPFLAADARKAAEFFNATGRRSRTLADCPIAAVALRCSVKLATGNTADFAAMQSHGLVLA